MAEQLRNIYNRVFQADPPAELTLEQLVQQIAQLRQVVDHHNAIGRARVQEEDQNNGDRAQLAEEILAARRRANVDAIDQQIIKRQCPRLMMDTPS